jgi:hypothetical protein
LVIRRPLKVVFGGFSPTNTYRLIVINADGSPIHSLRVPAISLQIKTTVGSSANWDPLGLPPSLSGSVLQLDAPSLPSKQSFYRAVETP